jgi:hypothetical protein
MSPAASRQTMASKEPSGKSSARASPPDDPHPVRHAPLLDQLPSLADLLAADVDRRDVAAVALGDAYRGRAEAAADVEDVLPPYWACLLGD